jgi:hypothetical protein
MGGRKLEKTQDFPVKNEVKIIEPNEESTNKGKGEIQNEIVGDPDGSNNNKTGDITKLKIKRQITQSNSTNSLSEEASNQLLSVFNGSAKEVEKKEETKEVDSKGPISLTEKLKLRANKFKKK